ncbi:hypothetical protein [Halomicrobium zhouii]|uniref:hypothetical protein n=1 Tax=Halomicrobium zhouii TaxID=767519 RepID=UPI0015A6D25D|nr:hypothetical protein [Halomicrobium zhouii]
MASQPNVYVLSVDSLRYSSFEMASESLAARIDGINFINAVGGVQISRFHAKANARSHSSAVVAAA